MSTGDRLQLFVGVDVENPLAVRQVERHVARLGEIAGPGVLLNVRIE